MGTWPQKLPQACFCLLGGSTHCCDIYSGKEFSCWRHWLCLVGGLGEEREWRKESGQLDRALPARLGQTESRLLSPCLLGTPKKPIFQRNLKIDMEGGPGGGQNAQSRKSRGTAYLSSDIRLGLSFEGCHQQWEGSRPVRSGQASPLSLLLDTQGLIDSQGLAAPQERSCSVSTDPCVHKELPPGACGGCGGWAHTRCESHLWPTGLVLNAQTQGPAWLTCWDRSSQFSPASTRQEVRI